MYCERPSIFSMSSRRFEILGVWSTQQASHYGWLFLFYRALDDMGARTGPNHGPIRAFWAIFARTGPNNGPVRALKGGMIFAKTAIGITWEHT